MTLSGALQSPSFYTRLSGRAIAIFVKSWAWRGPGWHAPSARISVARRRRLIIANIEFSLPPIVG
jgi:hypothetical protein